MSPLLPTYLQPVGNIGWNISGQGMSGDNVQGWILNEMKAAAVTVINETRMCEAFVSRIPYPIFRMRGSDASNDDSAYSKFDAYAFVERLHSLAPVGSMLYLGNEFNSDNIEKQDTWTAHAVDRCVQLGHRPVVHCQSVFHPLGGIADIKKYRVSTRKAIEAGGVVGQHIYVNENLNGEIRKPDRNPYSPIFEWRTVYGSGFPIICTEYSYAKNYDAHAGPIGRISWELLRDLIIEAADFLSDFQTYLQIYGLFKPGTEWDSFNLWDTKDPYHNPLLLALASWNRNNPMVMNTPQQPTTLPAGATPKPAKMVEIISLPTGNEWREIRNRPEPTGTDVGDLRVGDQVFLYMNNQMNGWVAIQRPSDRKEGWVLWVSGISYREVTMPNVDEFKITPDQFTRLGKVNSDLTALLAEIKQGGGGTVAGGGDSFS